jgi:hypothetical protein
MRTFDRNTWDAHKGSIDAATLAVAARNAIRSDRSYAALTLDGATYKVPAGIALAEAESRGINPTHADIATEETLHSTTHDETMPVFTQQVNPAHCVPR